MGQALNGLSVCQGKRGWGGGGARDEMEMTVSLCCLHFLSFHLQSAWGLQSLREGAELGRKEICVCVFLFHVLNIFWVQRGSAEKTPL